MDTWELYYLLNNSSYTASWNPVVCAKDELPHRKAQDHQAYVINTDDSHLPGTHWVAVYFPQVNCVEYFDSYGLPPLEDDIIDFMRRNAQTTQFNNVKLQSNDSMVCGQYCVYFLHHRSLGHSLEHLVTYFDRDSSRNDQKVDRWFCDRYGYLLSLARKRSVHQWPHDINQWKSHMISQRCQPCQK
jgi:hypothetical protein